MKKQLQRYRGYTLAELLIAMFVVSWAAFVVFVVIHFIHKWW